MVISLFLLGNNDNRQIHAIRSYTVGLIGALQNAVSVIPNVIELKRENEILHRLNVDLSDEASRLREARLENIRLRSMMNMKNRGEYTLVPAGVIGKSLHLLRNTITLDVGEQDGVKPDMPIISELGLVGKVIATSAHYSIGQLVLNKDFRASAKVERSRVDGIITWEGGEVLHLKNISKKQDVIEGDVVVTSEYSNTFPRDIKIGIVSGISEKAGSLFKEVDLSPGVDFSALEEVFVVTALADTERTSLEKRALHSK
jgi:rod shape-determining protein MreC